MMLWPATGQAQMHHHHPAPADTTHHPKPTARPHSGAAHGRAAHSGITHAGTTHAGMDMAGMDMGHMSMTGLYGSYAMSREASGTSWQPQSARHEGVHVMRGPWMAMLHGSADLVHDHQGGDRGDEKFFSSNMAMGMAQRSLGPGTLGLRAMLSLEPATIGKD